MSVNVRKFYWSALLECAGNFGTVVEIEVEC